MVLVRKFMVILVSLQLMVQGTMAPKVLSLLYLSAHPSLTCGAPHLADVADRTAVVAARRGIILLENFHASRDALDTLCVKS